jgi:NitT/TauT family transport system substrate-binding protein
MLRVIRVALAAALLGALAISPVAGQDDADRSAGTDIRMGAFKGPTGVGLLRMLEQGVSLPDGGQVSVTLVQAPPVMVSRVVNGEFDAAVLPVNLAARLYNGGQPIVLAAIVGRGMLSVVSDRAEISGLEDLRGADVHVAGQGGTPEYLMRYLLEASQIEPGRDVNLRFGLAPPEIAASLIADRIDTAVLPEPFATMAVQGRDGVRKRINLQEVWAELPDQPADYPMTAFVVRRELAETRPDAIRQILEAYEASLSWVQDNPAEAAQLVGRHDLGLPPAVARAAIPDTNYAFVPANAARREVETLLDAFLRFAPQSIGGTLPDARFYWP